MDHLPALDDWDPLMPAEMATMFKRYPGTWCIAGGWALDLFGNRPNRPHSDIDVVVVRHDLHMVHDAFPGWLLYAAGDGKLAPWNRGEPLPGAIHDIWCRREHGPWEFQLMVAEVTDTEWIFRRDTRIRGPLEAMIVTALAGLPVLAPEIQLLYKSRLPNRPKDELDFTNALPHLTSTQRARLSANLRRLYGDHPWLARLQFS